jgi:membrane-bound lytic murein transglycosylase A
MENHEQMRTHDDTGWLCVIIASIIFIRNLSMKSSSIRYLTLLSLLLLVGCSETPIIEQPVVYPSQASKPQVPAQKIIPRHPEMTAAEIPPPVAGAPINTNVGSLQLYPSDFNLLPGWQEEDHTDAYRAFRHSCKRWRGMPASKMLTGSFPLGSVGDWQQVCNIHVMRGQEKQFFEHYFKPYAVSENGNFTGLFTGYYLPELHGSYTKSARYNVPIYRMPNGALRNQSRAAIYSGALANKGLELLWVDNEIDAYFMEVQGSGRVIMDDGTILGLGFAGGNGHAYYAIGKTLVDNGEIAREDISMQTIRQWIEQHPVEGRQLMLSNESYVFFRFTPVDPSIGPNGAMGVPLTAQHSLAVDKRHLPMGVPIWLDAQHPVAGERFRRLVMAQDTGGAIKGAIRGDVYWGQGAKASEMAGPMKSKGHYFLLLPHKI